MLPTVPRVSMQVKPASDYRLAELGDGRWGTSGLVSKWEVIIVIEDMILM